MGRLPEPYKSLRAELERLREQQQRLIRASPFSGTGMSIPEAGTTQVDGKLIVQSGEVKSGNYVPATSGWHLGSDGTAEFKDVLLYDVPNSMLANPVSTGQAFVGTSGFGLSVAGAWLLTRTATVPTGFDTVTVSAFGRVAAVNSTATDDALYSSIDIAGQGGNQFGTDVRAGRSSTSSVGFSTTLTGLTAGATVTTRLFASTGLASWASNAANGADLAVTLLWTR